MPILYFLLPASLFIGFLLLSMATGGLGLMRVSEIYFTAAIGTGLALLYCAIVAFAFPSARSPYSSLYFALTIFCVNGTGFALAVLTPLSPICSGVKRFYDRYGRQIIIADMYLTTVSLTFLWLAVVGAI